MCKYEVRRVKRSGGVDGAMPKTQEEFDALYAEFAASKTVGEGSEEFVPGTSLFQERAVCFPRLVRLRLIGPDLETFKIVKIQFQHHSRSIRSTNVCIALSRRVTFISVVLRWKHLYMMLSSNMFTKIMYNTLAYRHTQIVILTQTLKFTRFVFLRFCVLVNSSCFPIDLDANGMQ